MIKFVNASDFYNILDNSSVLIALFYQKDNLKDAAIHNLRKLSNNHIYNIYNYIACLIANEEDAEHIQIIKLPQYRFFRKGSEVASIIGNVPLDILINVLKSNF